MKRIVCIGECMVEMAQEGDADRFVLGFAGDTYNTAVYFKRQLGQAAEVAYLTALGDDALSTKMISRFQDEGIRVDLVRIFPGKRPGLYLIENDERGERFFQYWRSESAARSMFLDLSPGRLSEILSGFDLIHLSGISLAILDEGQRRVLFQSLHKLRDEKIVAFDPNLRVALWPDLETARQAFQMMGAIASIVLVSLDDEINLWTAADKENIIKRWHAWGCAEVVLKDGSQGCLISKDSGLVHVPASENRKPLDTTGAGDAFCAGYLSERLTGASIRQAARAAHHIAAQVIMHRGAVIPPALWYATNEKGRKE